jgi:thiamine pyrophosphokinase
MLRACLVCSRIDHPIPLGFDVYVGVDKGALVCLDQGIVMDMAIGDFDSVTSSEKEEIQANAKTFVKLPVIKDESDSEAAISCWVNKVDSIVMLGALGARQDHQYVNMQLMKRYPKVELKDKNNHLMIVSSTRILLKDNYQYVSLFALEDSIVSIGDVKYPLQQQKLTPYDLFALSNEFNQEEALLTITSGKLLVILSKDQ